jgi:hypothetical protein
VPFFVDDHKLPALGVARSTVLAVGIAVLLLPSFVMATVYTSLDLEVASAAVTVCVSAAFWAPRFKWPCAAVGSLPIAVPPYPYWLSRDVNRGWYFHPFYGFTLQTTPFMQFLGMYLLALVLFAAIFWAVRKRGDLASNHRWRGP